MSQVGPSLPPHLTKRSRDDDGDRASSSESSEKRRRVLGPALPPASPSRSSSPESDIGPAPPPSIGPAKPTRVLGPAPPPAPLSERPPNPPSDDDSDSSSDDDFGPAPPPADASYASTSYDNDQPQGAQPSAFDTDPQYAAEAAKPQRDAWMTMPPTQDDLAARMDPTKMRARKFNVGKPGRASASGGGGGGMGVWTETPEQKLKRLQDEALGISAPANSADAAAPKGGRKSKEEEERARRMREELNKVRGKSMMEQHKEKGTGKDLEDDPSKRGFDWEKDMGSGMKIDNRKREDLLKRAKGFGDRFSSGSFL